MSNVSILDGQPSDIRSDVSRSAGFAMRDSVIRQVLLMARKSAESIPYNHDRQATVFSSQLNAMPAYWEDILREFVFRTISPPPPGNNVLYKRILEAPFYGGPLPTFPQDAITVVLSRGDVFYNPILGSWLLCQEGCTDCDVCQEQKNPTVKWVLRRIKRQPAIGPSRHDLQLTIVPQDDDSFHMKNLGPRSYVYVTSQVNQQQSKILPMPRFSHWRNVPPYDTDSLIDQNYSKPGEIWRLIERNIKEETKDDRFGAIIDLSESTVVPPIDTDTLIRPEVLVPPQSDTGEQKHRSKNLRRSNKHRTTTSLPSTTPSAPPEDIVKSIMTNNVIKPEKLAPKIIMGTDQHGQKQLVHVVLVEDLNNEELVLSNFTLTNDSRSSYEKLYNRMVDSLTSHKRSIEKFLETPMQRVIEDREESSINFVGTRELRESVLPSPTASQNDTKKDEQVQAPMSSVSLSERNTDSQQINLEYSQGSDVRSWKEERGNSTVEPERATNSYKEVKSKATSVQRRRQKTRTQRFDDFHEESNSRNRPRRIRITPLESSAAKRMRAGQNFNESLKEYPTGIFSKPLPSSMTLAQP